MSLTLADKRAMLTEVRDRVNTHIRSHAKGGDLAEHHLLWANRWAYVEGLIAYDIERSTIYQHGASAAVSMTRETSNFSDPSSTPECSPPRTALPTPQQPVPPPGVIQTADDGGPSSSRFPISKPPAATALS